LFKFGDVLYLLVPKPLWRPSVAWST